MRMLPSGLGERAKTVSRGSSRSQWLRAMHRVQLSKIRNTFVDEAFILNGIAVATGPPSLLDRTATGGPIGLGSKARSYLLTRSSHVRA